PIELGDFSVTVTATDATGAQGSAVFPLHVSELELTSSGGGTYGTPLSTTLRIIGGRLPYTSAIVNSSPSFRLPAGLTLDAATQILSGTPLESGSFSPEVVFTPRGNPAHTLHLRSFMFIAGPGTSTIQIGSSSDLGTFTSQAPLNFQIFACCLPSVVWSQLDGIAPAGMVLTPQPGGNATVTTSTAPAPGVYTFRLQVENVNDPPHFAVRQFTLTVSPLFVTATFPFPFANVGSPYSQSLTATGGT